MCGPVVPRGGIYMRSVLFMKQMGTCGHNSARMYVLSNNTELHEVQLIDTRTFFNLLY